MRKYVLSSTIALALVMAFGFTSCKKDGVYNPNKKISRVFTQSGGSKELASTWTWEKNKLSKIDYGSYFERYEYEKNQISKIIDSDGDYLKYTYNGSKIDKIEVYYSTRLYRTYKFEHKGSKISKITTERYYYNDYASTFIKNSQISALRFILPEQACEDIAKLSLQKKNRKGMETYTSTIKLTWKGNNVEETVYEETYDNEVYTSTSKYTYDKMKNPFYGYLSNADVESKNNVTKSSTTDSDNDFWEYEYSYSYDGKFPKEVTSIYKSGTYTDTYTRFYEYVD